MKSVLLFSILAALPLSRATTIVAARFQKGIVVLSDSKPTFFRPGGPTTVCKIVPVKNAFIAVSGMVRDPSRRFDVEKIAAKTFESSDSFLAKVRHSTELIRQETTKQLLHLRTEDSEQYRFALKNEGNVVDILFVAFEKGVPKLAARRLHWDESKSTLQISKRQDCPGVDCPNGNFLSRMGEVSEIEKFINSDKTGAIDETTLGRLMVQQTKSTPTDVGMPIEILSLQESGASWHSNELGCPLQP